MGVFDSSQDILPWLKTLPLAPEYRPSLSEFNDPIAYILKIEKEASKFGICKIIPPLPPSPKRTVISNFNRSLSSRSPNSKKSPTFTTRQQQVGLCPRRPRPVKKPVWQSGESYTFQQFEAKARQFEKAQLRKVGKKLLSALETESLFWKACGDKPFSVEYANDMPGSAFSEVDTSVGDDNGIVGETIGESAWNMRRISRAKGSLLRFMKEEIPGVTSPMVYVAMMFSWFAWHVEDHDLHSLNYLHLGSAKTWYGVPRDAAIAFEEVVRMHGYGGQVNPLVTFAILGEKTTVMSPEVLIEAGVPCCRLVQNAGEFVVTFPRAYHSGFSHGFNCGEAANIATPEWLKVAKEAAIRRASINYPPMVSHFQLLTLALCSRGSAGIVTEPHSSRLKDKRRDEGDVLIKEQFVYSIAQNNDLLYLLLEKGSSCVLLPPDTSVSRNSHIHGKLGYQVKMKPRLSVGVDCTEKARDASNVLLSNDIILDRSQQLGSRCCFSSRTGKPATSLTYEKKVALVKHNQFGTDDYYFSNMPARKANCNSEGMTFRCDGLLEQGLLPCVTCGILSFACVAVIQPRAEAQKYLMSADCGFPIHQIIDSTLDRDQHKNISDEHLLPGSLEDGGLVDVVVQYGDYQLGIAAREINPAPLSITDKGMSALDLLASAYADSSDSDAEVIQPGRSNNNSSPEESFSSAGYSFTVVPHAKGLPSSRQQLSMYPFDVGSIGDLEIPVSVDPLCIEHPNGDFSVAASSFTISPEDRRYSDEGNLSDNSSLDMLEKSSNMSLTQRMGKGSSRMHIFCLEHAVQVERQLHPLGGADMLLLCHPDYPKMEAHAKLLAAEMDMSCYWKTIPFRKATKNDKLKIRTALDDEEAVPASDDWAVKMSVNLYYSSNLSRSPLYSMQMPYNSVIYRVFGQASPNTFASKPKVYSRRKKKHKRIVVAGNWCGKVWMSNQVHPYLAREADVLEDEDEVCSWNDAHQTGSRKIVDSMAIATQDQRKTGRKLKSNIDIFKQNNMKYSQLGENIAFEERTIVNTMTGGNVFQPKKKEVKEREKSSGEDGGPSTRLRRRMLMAEVTGKSEKIVLSARKQKKKKVASSSNKMQSSADGTLKNDDAEYKCDIEGCFMSFTTKQELTLHRRNICCVKGCGKKFFSHKYLVQHRRVHLDDRPLKCPWKGCTMSFKWAWARTEHIRVHTGDRPYVCHEVGCGQTFRFVSDFSRHKRKTGHSTKKRGRA